MRKYFVLTQESICCYQTLSVPLSFVPFALCLFVFSSCSFQRTAINDPITPEKIQFMRRGETTMAMVLTELGAPQEITSDGQYNIFRYSYQISKSFRFNPGLLLRLFSPVSVPISTTAGNAGRDIFEVAFDREGIVQDFTFWLRSPEVAFNPWPF